MSRDLVEVAMALISLTLVSMLVMNSDKTATVVKASGQTFGGLLSVASFQGGGAFNSL